MTPDHDHTRTLTPHSVDLAAPPAPPGSTVSFDPDLDAGLAAAFGSEPTPGGWSHPPLLRDEPSDTAPLVQPSSSEIPRGADERYQLLGEIARGGMGVIIKGRDPDLGRDLAFKVLRTELVGRPGAEQRFVEEAQVGGQLQHPGVVPVYDLGRFADGRPYFAMKLVKGRTLAELLAERPDPGHDRGRFVRHFLQVCQAVGYAHSRGVIHRDLKPANIMVGAFDEVLVMDWGLAKVLPRGGIADEHEANRAARAEDAGTEIRTARVGSGSETAAGSVMGTLAFMPPEQAGGETDKLDERADVFGLGAILCVILTGQTPYLGNTVEAIRLKAVRGQLADAFARLDGCGADAELVALCKRCVSAERDARPRTARVVAEAVAAHLAGVEERGRRAERDRAAAEARAQEEANTRREAEGRAAAEMSARREAEGRTVAERKRRRAQVGLVAAVGAVLAVAGAFGWYADRQASEQRAERERVERKQAENDLRHQFEEKQREAAERSRRERNAEAVAGLLSRVERALRDGDPAQAQVAWDAAENRAREGGSETMTDRLTALRADLVVLGKLDEVDRYRWTPYGSARPSAEKVAARFREALRSAGADPDTVPVERAAARVSGSVVRDRLVAALDRVLRTEKSARVRDALRRVDPDPFRNAVRDAVAGDASRLTESIDRPEGADQPLWFVVFLAEDGTIAPQRRRELLAAAVATGSGDLGLLMGMGGTYPINRPDGAVERVRWFQAAAAAAPKNPAVQNSLGTALHDKKDYDGAIAAYQEAIRLDKAFAPAYSNLGAALNDKKDYDGAIRACTEAIRIDPEFTPAHSNLGDSLNAKKDYDGAIRACTEAIRLDKNFAPAYSNLGSALNGKKDYEGSIEACRGAIRIDRNYAPAHNNLGTSLDAKGDHEGAIEAFRESIRLDKSSSRAHSNLGVALCATRDYEGAIAAFREAIRLDQNDSVAHFNLGVTLREKGDHKGAIAEYEEAIRSDPDYAPAHYNLGNALVAKRNYDGAIEAYRAAIRSDPALLPAHISLGNALVNTKDSAGAIAAYKKAIRLDKNSAAAHYGLGLALHEAKDSDGAIAAYREAIRLDPGHPETNCNLGLMLLRGGKPLDAAPLLRRGDEFGRKRPGWPYPSARWVEQCEAQLQRDGLLAPPPRPVER